MGRRETWRHIGRRDTGHRQSNGGPMPADDHTLIRVHRNWDGWWTADVRVSDLQDVHWLQPDRAPRPLLHGYVSCANVCAGDIPHDCEVAHAPHQLFVCVLKRHTPPWLYLELARRADEAQRCHRPDAQELRVWVTSNSSCGVTGQSTRSRHFARPVDWQVVENDHG
jgi:hypothetical protein